MDHQATLTRLRDIEAIKQLKARYFRFVDTRDWPGFRSVFTDDFEFVYGETRIRGGDDFVGWVRGNAVPGRVTVHHGHTPEIDITGADAAHGIWAMADYVEYPPEQGIRRGVRGYGHYEEEYRRGGGVWKIARLQLTRVRVDPLSGSSPAMSTA